MGPCMSVKMCKAVAAAVVVAAVVVVTLIGDIERDSDHGGKKRENECECECTCYARSNHNLVKFINVIFIYLTYFRFATL